MAKTRRVNRKASRKSSRKTQAGGKRKGNAWSRKVTELYRKMKKEDSKVEFRDALKKASQMRKAGKL